MAAVGRERFVAGSSGHALLKVFDLRLPGGKAYSFLDAHTCKEEGAKGSLSKDQRPRSNEHLDIYDNAEIPKTNWSMFADAYGSVSRRHHDSSVYSLSVPSPDSSRLFIGLENRVLQMDFVSPVDEANRSCTRQSPALTETALTQSALQQQWNPNNDLLGLAAYSHVEVGDIKIRLQGSLGRYLTRKGDLYLDERWEFRTSPRFQQRRWR